MRRSSIVLAFFSLVVLSIQAVGQPFKPSGELLLRRAAVAAQDYAAERRCGRLNASWLLLLRQQRDELRANTIGLAPELSGRLDEAVATSEKAAAAEDCTGKVGSSPAGLERLQRLTLARNLKYVDAAAILDIEQWLPYAAHLTELSARTDTIRRVVDDIESRGNLALIWVDRITAMRLMLSRICPERKSVRWNDGERPCPQLSTPENERQFDVMVVKDIEAFIAADDEPLPSDVPSYWTVNRLAGDHGAVFCHIERRLGNAMLSGDAGDGGIFSFALGADLPVPEAAHLAMEGDVGVDGVPAIIVRKVRLSFRGPAAPASGDKTGEMTVGKMRFSANRDGDSLVLDERHNNSLDKGNLMFLGLALMAVPHIAATLPAGGPLEADVPDIALLLKDTAHLRQAYRRCWR
jgi:hypothetical protein